jgi:hypothetical protein
MTKSERITQILKQSCRPMTARELTVDIAGYIFYHVQDIHPARNSYGQVEEFMPQSQYLKRAISRLNPHGRGPFCRFSLDKKWQGFSGVYALIINGVLMYIGETVDLYKRFNTGYGNISPKNCYQGGQPTNCKINNLILNKYLNNEITSVYFVHTSDYKRIEKSVLSKVKPYYNGR